MERSKVLLFLLEGLDKDPLSPYLFLLCYVRMVLYDSSLMPVAESSMLPIFNWEGPQISHLIFANDSVVFNGASNKEAQRFGDCQY